MVVDELPTPALLIDAELLEHNLGEMSTRWPGRKLRPHVKAHKCTALAARQVGHGHSSFTCATPLEVLGLVAAGVGDDLLLANESLDPARLAALAGAERRADGRVSITVAVDSPETVAAAATAGLRSVLIDVNVGLPRCGCSVDDAGPLAAAARRAGLEVRGVMGYEGHLMMVGDHDERSAKVSDAMARLHRAHAAVGGDVISAGGTGTFDVQQATGITELQAGSYALLDTAYATLDSPFVTALSVLGTVISATRSASGTLRWAVADVGLKALGMDHGNPDIAGAQVLFCSDEHVTFAAAPDRPEAHAGAARPVHDLRPGDRVRVVPAHVDPTMAQHDAAWLVRGDEVLGRWPIDLRGW